MKNFLIFLLLFLVFKSNAYTQEDIKRTVIEENDNIAWKVDDKFIMPECFDYVWSSGDRYETFFDEYIEKLDTSHWKDPRFQNFIVEIGKYLNKEVPLNHSIFNIYFKFPKGLPKIHEHDGLQPKAMGIFNDNELILLFTYESDLNDGWEDPEVHNDSKSIRKVALKMGANIIKYAFEK